MRQPKRLKILNVDNGITLDELETLKQRLFHLKINEDGPVAMKLRLLDSNGFEDIDFCILLHLTQWIDGLQCQNNDFNDFFTYFL